MELTREQKEHVYEQGYVKVPGVVPQERVNAALRAINHSLGEGVDPSKLPTLRAELLPRTATTARHHRPL